MRRLCDELKDRGWMIRSAAVCSSNSSPILTSTQLRARSAVACRLDDLDAMVALVNAAEPGKSTGWPRFKAPQLEASAPEDRLPDRSRLHAGAADPEP